MKTFKRNFSFLLTVCFLIIFVTSISAQMIRIPIEEITIKSSKILKGVVINKHSEFENNSEYIFTVINISVMESIKGQVKQVESVVIPGGVVGNLGMEVSGVPKFELNDEVLVFIDYDLKGRQTVTEWNQGKFLIKNNCIVVDEKALIISDFIMNLKDFIQKGQVGKIEINNDSNPPNSPMLLMPTITNIAPNMGAALRPYAINPNNPFIPGEKGTIIDIYGSNFGSTQGTSVVRFYENIGEAADAQYILIWSDTHIQCKLPGSQWDGSHFLNASSGSFYVITSAGESNGQQFDISFATSNKRFSNNIITFYVNENGTPDVSDEFAVIQSSLQTWSSILNSNHSFLYAGTTIRTPGSRNNYNDIGWIESNWPYASTTIAVTTTWFDATENSNIIFESDIAINGVNYTWSSSGQTDRMDIQNIVTHELGHTLNLQDLYGNTDIEKTMYGYSGNGVTKQRTLESADISGVVYLYPTPYSLSLYNNFEFDGNTYGQLNIKNITQATNSISYNSPINQTIYYGSSFETSVASIYNINGRNYYFAGWDDDITLNNPRIINATYNQNISALYKYPHHSTTGSFANSGQRKVIKCDYGYLHLVYESMGYVWYERSTDNGATWHIMNGGKPIDKNPSKSPSIDFYYGYQRLIIVYQTWAGDNSEFAAIKAACFANGQLQFTTTVYESYLSIYSEVNYKPVVGYASNDKIAVAWEDYGVWVKTGVLSFSTNQVTWNNIVGVDNNNTANINPTIAAYKTTPGTATFHLAWQNNYSTIRYCNLTEQSKGSFLVSAVDQVSQGCGFPVNYYPSINVSNSNDVQLVWIGTPYYGSTYRKALSRSRTTGWSSSFAQYGNNILSPDVAFYTGSSVVSWSENPSGNTYTNKFIKYGSVKTAGTTGKDVRIFNASTLQDMHLVSFTTNSLPYAFTHSANLNSINKDNSLVMASGVQAVAFKDGVEYFFRIGDINFNGSNIDFESFEDTSGVLSLEDLNTNLITNTFTANETNNLVYSIEYGVTDSVLALVQLQNKFISFRVELIDQLTGVVLAELNNIQMDGNNVEKLKTATFSFNITGLPNSSLAIRLKLNNNLEPQYAAAVIKSDESVLLKNNPIELNLSGTETVKEYALDQNYPNPFNPSTIIKFQIPKDGYVTLKVYDILGNEIATLLNEEKPQGKYEVNFNASSLASGVYIYKIQADDFVSSKKMLLLK